MTDGGSSSGLPFHPKEEDYGVDIDENLQSPQDGYGMDDRSRCKRRKRCGQCGPCQVKENCMKCHFCVRKDVLKQTCIYRKCVYLRSKPKPYSRPHHSPQVSGRMSPGRDMGHAPPMVKSPPVTGPGQHSFGPEQGMHMSDIRPENPFLQHLPHQQQPPLGALPNHHGYLSPPNPMMSSPTTNSSSLNMNMQMSVAPQLQNHASSPPLQKLSNQLSPHVNAPPSVNSPPGASMSSIPQVSSVGSIQQVPAIPPVVSTVPPILPPMTSSSLPGMPPIPSIPTMPGINDRSAINEFRHPDQLSLHHPHHPFPSVPGVHPHMTHREPNLFGDHTRIPHMNFNPTNHMDTFSRGPGDSSCMYHPGLPYSMPGHFQPSGPSFLSGAAEMNPFRSNFINSFPPGYSYPPDRYRESFGSLPFPRLGMSSASFPQYPGQGAGYGMGNSFSQQYSPYNSQHGCPKNGSRPPVSPSIDDVKVLQEGYEIENDQKSDNDNSNFKIKEEPMSDENDEYSGKRASSPTASEQSRLWNYYGVDRTPERSSSRFSEGSKSSFWEPWRMPYLCSPRRDDARSRTCSSTVSSDFECEISIDDHPLNALIRSDGCNSIEIAFDNKSMYNDDSSPRKLASRSSTVSDFMSPEKSQRSFSDKFGRNNDSCEQMKKPTSESLTGTKPKMFVDGTVCIKQNLGEEGIVQLELPGHRVSIENVEFTEECLNKSSNVAELKEFLCREPETVNQSA